MNNGVASGGGVFPDAGTQQGPGGAGAAQGGGTNDQEPPQKKRKPILTLKVERIFSDKGLSYIEKEFPKLKFKGKGHEVSKSVYRKPYGLPVYCLTNVLTPIPLY